MTVTAKRNGGLKRLAQCTNDMLLRTLADILNDKPLPEINAKEVARRAGVSSATFYSYFENLEDAVSEMAVILAAEMESKLSKALAEAACTDMFWAEAFKIEYDAVLEVFNGLCVENTPLLAAVTSLAAGRGNDFSDALTRIRNSLVRTLLAVAHYNPDLVDYPSYLLDTEASAMLMFHILPLGVDQEVVSDDLYNRTMEIAHEWCASGKK